MFVFACVNIRKNFRRCKENAPNRTFFTFLRTASPPGSFPDTRFSYRSDPAGSVFKNVFPNRYLGTRIATNHP